MIRLSSRGRAGHATCSTFSLMLLALAVAAPAGAQDGADNVFHDGESLPWGELNGGVRMLPLYGDPSAEGKLFAFRLEVHPGFEMGPHTHPVAEHLTVLSGRFFVGLGETMDREAAKAYGPGSYIAIAADAPAYMWVEEVTVVQVHGVGPFTTTFVGPPAEGRADEGGGRG